MTPAFCITVQSLLSPLKLPTKSPTFVSQDYWIRPYYRNDNLLSIRQFSLRHVSDICYRHVSDIYTDIYTDIITANITATLPPLPPTFLPQEKIFAKNPPTQPIYNKVGRGEEDGLTHEQP